MPDEQVLREEIRNLKLMIRDDPAVLAQYDLDGDGKISGEEWDYAVQKLREALDHRPEAPAEATRSAFESLRDRAQPSLVSSSEIVVKQAVERREIFMNYETCNRYTFLDGPSGTEIGGAQESSGGIGGFLNRQFLGSGRALALDITDAGTGTWMEGQRPFSPLGFILPPAMTVNWNQGLLGTVRRVWPILLRRRYQIAIANDLSGGLLIDGSILKPWTFPVHKRGRQVASILKKWSGGLREVFTDADTFLVRIEDPSLTPAERLLLVAAALAIDFDYFESSNND